MLTLSWTRSDEQIVRRVLAGKRNDFGVLVNRHLPSVLALSRAYLANTSDAEDVAQECFITAYQKLDTLKKPDKFIAWLMVIARNTALNWRRRTPSGIALDDAGPVAPLAEAPAPERKEMQQLLHKTLLELPVETREVLMLHYYSGCSLREIAGTLGISRDAAAKRVRRARESLGEAFLKTVPEARREFDMKKCARRITMVVLTAGALWRATPAYGAVLGLTIMAGKLGAAAVALLVLITGAFLAAPTLLGWEPVFPKTAAAPAPAVKNTEEPAQEDFVLAAAPVEESPAFPEGRFSFSNVLVTIMDKPVGDARVVIERVTWKTTELPPPVTQTWTTTANHQGAFTFEGLPPGVYSVTAMTRLSGGAHDFRIDPQGHVSGPRNIKMYPLIRSYGVLLDADRRPVSGAAIYPISHEFFKDTEFDHVTIGGLRAKTDDQGRFRFPGLIPGKWKFMIVSPDRPPYRTDYIACYGLQSTVIMKSPGRLLARVVDRAGNPVPAIKGTVHTLPAIRFYDLVEGKGAERGYWMNFPFTADENGLFSVPSLAAGEWFFTVEDPTLALENPLFSVKVTESVETRADLVVTPGGIVSGHIRDSKTQRGIPGIEVEVYSGRVEVYIDKKITTDSEGAYQLAGLPESNYIIQVRETGGYLDNNGIEQFQITTGGPGVTKDLFLEAPLKIHGRCIHADGSPAKAKIVAQGLSQYAQAETDDQGIFALAFLEPGTIPPHSGGTPAGAEVTIRASEETMASAPVTIDLRNDQEKEWVLSLDVAAAGRIEGVVLTADNQPAANLYIYLNEVRPDNHAYCSSAMADHQGTFSFSGLTAGRYSLSVQQNLLATPPMTVDLAENQAVKNIVLQEVPKGAMTITGTLYLPSGLPAPIAAVGLADGPKDTTGPLGRFEIKGVAEGVHTLYALTPGCSPLVVKNIPAGARGLELYFPKGAVISGTVVDGRNQQPIQEFTVSYQSVNMFPFDSNGLDRSSSRIHDEGGAFRIEKAPVIPISVSVVAPGYAAWTTTLSDLGDEEERSLVVSLWPAAQIDGIVYDEAGNPLAGVQVAGVVTDADGKFTLPYLSSGETFTLRFSREGYAPLEKEVLPGTDTTVEVTMAPSGSIVVTALWEGQTPPFSVHPCYLGGANTGSDASFTVEGNIPTRITGRPGEVEVEVRAFDCTTETHLYGRGTATIIAGQDVPLEVPLAPVEAPASEGEEVTDMLDSF